MTQGCIKLLTQPLGLGWGRLSSLLGKNIKFLSLGKVMLKCVWDENNVEKKKIFSFFLILRLLGRISIRRGIANLGKTNQIKIKEMGVGTIYTTEITLILCN